jgi:hypothetical protein
LRNGFEIRAFAGAEDADSKFPEVAHGASQAWAAWRRLFALLTRFRPAHIVRRLTVGELVLILDRLLEAVKFGFEFGHSALEMGLVIDIPQFLGVHPQIVHFPLILFPKMNEFMGLGPHP